MSGTTQRFLRYEVSSSSTATKHSYIDLARDLSYLNSRTYKQGREYFIKSIRFMAPTAPSGTLTVSTLPCSWQVKKAYRKARTLWNKMNRMAISDSGIGKKVYPKYHQFITSMYGNPLTLTNLEALDSNLTGQDHTGSYDWNISSYVSTGEDDGTGIGHDEFKQHMLGNDVLSGTDILTVGIIKGYEQTRPLLATDEPEFPSEVNTNWMSTMFDDNQQESAIIQNMEADQTDPPYNADEVIGGTEMISPWTVGFTALGQQTPSGFVCGAFCAPLGLLEIQSQNDLAGNEMHLLVELASGPYMGVKSEAY